MLVVVEALGDFCGGFEIVHGFVAGIGAALYACFGMCVGAPPLFVAFLVSLVLGVCFTAPVAGYMCLPTVAAFCCLIGCFFAVFCVVRFHTSDASCSHMAASCLMAVCLAVMARGVLPTWPL